MLANWIEYGGIRVRAGECKWVSEYVSRAGDAVKTGVKASAAGRSRAGETVHVVRCGVGWPLASAIGSTQSREVSRTVI